MRTRQILKILPANLDHLQRSVYSTLFDKITPFFIPLKSLHLELNSASLHIIFNQEVKCIILRTKFTRQLEF